ncbi:hypothetical protein I7I50_10102 [Histoplasma capsulatum G186AR]|uniref:Uncharacterized protein n=1 Tax=Ajellomyces capsulatus TaxID=5037 RepID=A0A8H7Z7S0_AJECA|nr:hypothetical protein I7I52_01340 [Histoplasma capsulatum]QSS68955.1 hypothetical protein I7I50_10102 [Histoplasma capsulatum G186AR]
MESCRDSLFPARVTNKLCVAIERYSINCLAPVGDCSPTTNMLALAKPLRCAIHPLDARTIPTCCIPRYVIVNLSPITEWGPFSGSVKVQFSLFIPHLKRLSRDPLGFIYSY